MGNLLFSPSGRIGPNNFMRGAYVLIAVTLLINLLPMVSVTLAGILKLALLVVFYCWIALFIKRFHDGNKSGWMVLIPGLLSVIAAMIINGVVPPTFAPEIHSAMQEAMNEALTSSNPFGAVMEISQKYAEPLAKKTALPMAFSQAISSFAIAFLFNKMIKRDPNTNQHGVP